MVKKGVSAVDIMAEEGLGLYAAQLETLNPNIESVRLTKVLAAVLLETERLSISRHQKSKQKSAARECHCLAIEVIEDLAPAEEKNYRFSLIIGYLYGQQNYQQASDPEASCDAVVESIKGLSTSEENNCRRLFDVGYQYGRLIKPGNRTTQRGAEARINVMKADIKRSEGGQVTAQKKKASASSRKAYAKRIWEELVASGRPERGLAQVVAHRLGVADKTIREWRKSGWK